MMPYFFSLLRFVPDTARGEFVNLGAIAGDSEVADWNLRLISNMKRARAIDSEGHLPAAMSFLAELQERLPEEDDDSETSFALEDLNVLAASMNNVIQLTHPEPIVASDAEDALDSLWRNLLLDPEGNATHRFKNTLSAVGATKRAYRDVQLPSEAIKRTVELTAGRFADQFDFAVHNGQAIQLVKCFSFQRPNQAELIKDVKSWGWLMHELRDQGGTVKPRTGDALEAQDDLSVGSVYVPPADGRSADAFEQAKVIFAEVKVEACSYVDAGPIARIAQERLAAAAR
jgi:hypothetical protein